jgi:hypothetical protein
MSKRNGTIDTICVEISQALILLQDHLETPDKIDNLITELGYKLPESPTFLDEIPHYFSTFLPNLNKVLESYENNTYNEPEFYIKLYDLIESLIHLIDLINELPEKIDQQYHSYAGFLNNSGIKETFVLRLLDYLLINYFQKNQPFIFSIIELLGIVNVNFVQEGEYNPDYYLHKINWEYLTLLFSEPKEVFEKGYNWGKSEFNSDLLLDRIQNLFWSLGIGAEYESPNTKYISVIDGVESNELFEKSELRVPIWYDIIELGTNLEDFAAYEAGLAFCPSSDQNIEHNDGIAIRPFIEGEFGLEIDLGNQWFLHIGADIDISSGIGVVITPKTSIKIFNNIFSENPISDGKFEAKLERIEGDRLAILSFGGSNGSGIYINDISIALQTFFIQDETEVVLELSLRKATLVISVGEGDGFLQKVLPKDPLQIDFDFTFGISNKKGFYIKGGVGLGCLFRINKSIGPIFINTNADLNIGFKPPDGVGLSIDASGIVGGGFLAFDDANKRYTGVLTLNFEEIGLTAIGLITTKMPDGSEGFALLINIGATFNPPIQLSLSFNLSGVGGLIGVNRSMEIDALRTGLKNRTLDSILFPDPSTVIANASKIISDLRTVFPPAEERYVVGPMVKIGWGSPTIITADIGIFLEFPDPVRIVLLGQVEAALPEEKKALVVIHLDVLGVLDFAKEELTFQASLYDSRILSFTLFGDSAFLLGWGCDPRFALSLGGFHPKFTPPPPPIVFADLKRLTLDIGTGSPIRCSSVHGWIYMLRQVDSRLRGILGSMRSSIFRRFLSRLRSVVVYISSTKAYPSSV